MKSKKQSIRNTIRSIINESDNKMYLCNKHNTAYYEVEGAANTISELTRGKLLVMSTEMNENISKIATKVMVNGYADKLTSHGNSIFQLKELELAGTTHQLAKAINGDNGVAIVCNEAFKVYNK